MDAETVLYRTDGACRSQRTDDDNCCAFAAIRWQGGSVTGRHACMLGSVTNNIAEYCGLLSALQDALGRRFQRIALQTDSLLVARQVTGVWRCRSAELVPYYQKALHLLRQLRESGGAAYLQGV